MLVWLASVADQAIFIELWLVFWGDAGEPKSPWRDQTSVISRRSKLKKARLGSYCAQILEKICPYQVRDWYHRTDPDSKHGFWLAKREFRFSKSQQCHIASCKINTRTSTALATTALVTCYDRNFIKANTVNNLIAYCLTSCRPNSLEGLPWVLGSTRTLRVNWRKSQEIMFTAPTTSMSCRICSMRWLWKPAVSVAWLNSRA